MPLIDTLETSLRKQQTSYFGKYRAFVADTEDPEGLGRIRMVVPSVLGEAETDWALPAVAYGGGADFGMLSVPPYGSQVLAEFLEGDLSSPIWTGTFWRESADVPLEYLGQSTKILKTETGHLLTFEDKLDEAAVTLRSSAQAEVVLNADGGIALTDSAGAKLVIDPQADEISVEDAHGNTIVLSNSGITCRDINGNEIKSSASGVDVKSGGVVNIEGGQVTVGGAGGEPLIKGATFLSMFNSHTHATSAGPSGPPIPPLTPAVLTTKSTAQ